ncbi:unnamed protein product [Lactuca saligna]|uniref:Replication factor A C-terminal domain-containing protein n=1 Tax=Lactuca saligna TaxID=75948 RepID=A0AA36A033_LACSI|nr:unnamed protein product [Lactuca saligna]
MSNAEITYLDNIGVVTHDTKFKVKIFSTWNFVPKGKKEVMSIELIVMDEQGKKIQAHVFSGIVGVKSYWDASNLFVNVDILEINNYRKRFLIPINVQDGTGTISLMLFDKDASKMLEANADDLVKVVIEAGESQLFNQQTDVADSDEIKLVKDCASHTGDNVTPSNFKKSTVTSPIKLFNKTIDLKRNLHEMYDFDSPDFESATKSRRVSSGQSTPLFVPKKKRSKLWFGF